MPARWKLRAPHYLNVPGTEWEYKEVDRFTGRQKRTMFAVPLLLDPDNPQDWTLRHNQDEGDIIVTNVADSEFTRDLYFTKADGSPGEPTPDMEPLNEEAQTISASFAKKWQHPIEGLPGNFAEGILASLQIEVANLQSGQTRSQAPEGLSELMATMAAMMKQNQEMMAMLVQTIVPQAESARRV